jgi:pimeloyl-ACP methyl ester carboxylesterase
VHQGFANVASNIWGGIAAALQDIIKSNGKINNVYVAGHSLGAGVATLISYATQVGG